MLQTVCQRAGAHSMLGKRLVELHQYVRIQRCVLDLRSQKRSPIPIRALLTLVHQKSEHATAHGRKAFCYPLTPAALALALLALFLAPPLRRRWVWRGVETGQLLTILHLQFDIEEGWKGACQPRHISRKRKANLDERRRGRRKQPRQEVLANLAHLVLVRGCLPSLLLSNVAGAVRA